MPALEQVEEQPALSSTEEIKNMECSQGVTALACAHLLLPALAVPLRGARAGDTLGTWLAAFWGHSGLCWGFAQAEGEESWHWEPQEHPACPAALW